MVDRAPSLTLREARPEDLPLLLGWTRTPRDLALWAGATLDWPLDLQQLQAMLAEAPGERRRHLVATSLAQDAVVGHASITRSEDGHTARIGRILLDPAQRGRGLGSALIEAVVAAASTGTGALTLTLGVLADNHVARRHYDRLGFTPTGATTTVRVADQRWESTEMSRPA